MKRCTDLLLLHDQLRMMTGSLDPILAKGCFYMLSNAPYPLSAQSLAQRVSSNLEHLCTPSKRLLLFNPRLPSRALR